MDVIKRSGKKQKFARSKLERAIERAAKEGRVEARKVRDIAREVAEGIERSFRGRKSVRSVEIRRRTLRRLSSRSRAAVMAWMRYDRARRS